VTDQQLTRVQARELTGRRALGRLGQLDVCPRVTPGVERRGQAAGESAPGQLACLYAGELLVGHGTVA
jgi:hypothetical protein